MKSKSIPQAFARRCMGLEGGWARAWLWLRGAYLIFRATSAALIRGRRFFKNCTRQIYFFYIFIQRYTFYLLIFLWTDTKVKPWSQGWLIAAGAYPGFCSMKRLEVFLLPLDRMLVHRRSLPRNFVRFPQQIAGTHLYTWVERGNVRVKCLAQEHNTLSPARARTRTARSGVERTNHEATAPPGLILN